MNSFFSYLGRAFVNQLLPNIRNGNSLNQFSKKPLLHNLSRILPLNSYSTSIETSKLLQQPVKRELATPEEWADQQVLIRFHKAGPKIKHKPRHPLDNKPQMRGIVLKTLIKKPKKPNSANRKCVLVRLRTGKEVTVFVPGEGHNLQEHSVVLVEKRRVRDVPGLKLRVIRGAYDCAHVVKKSRTPA